MTGRPMVAGVVAMLRLSGRAEQASVLVILALAAVSSFVLTASARATDDAARRSVVAAIEESSDDAGRLTFTVEGVFSVGSPGSALEPVVAAMARVEEEVPAELDPVFGPPRLVMDTQRFGVASIDGAPTALPTYLNLRVHPELDDHLVAPPEELADAGTLERIEVPPAPDAEPDAPPIVLPVVDIGLTTRTAEDLGVGLGSVWMVLADDGDPLATRIPGPRFPPFAMRVARLLEPTPATEPYWYGDERLHRPVRIDTAVGADLHVFAAVEPEELLDAPFVDGWDVLVSVEGRHDIDIGAVDDLDVAAVGAARDALAGMEARYPTAPTSRQPGLRTGLGDVLRAEAGQRQVADAIRLLSTVGLVGVLGGVSAAVLMLGMMRRAGWTAVARSRGGGTAVAVAEVIETTVAVLVGTAVGLGAARLVLPDVSSPGDWAGAALLAAVLVACRIVVSVIAEAGHRAGSGRSRLRRVGPIALGVVVVVCIAGVVVVRRRGFSTDAPWRDPALVLLPALLPLVVGLGAAALVGPAARLVGRGGLGLGVGRLVGVRRLVADVSSHRLLLVVLAMSVATVVVGTAVASSIETGASVAAWRSVGAPYRLRTTDHAVLAATTEQLAPAPVAAGGTARVTLSGASRPVTVELHPVDTAALTEVRTDSPAHDEPDGFSDLVVLDTTVVPALTASILDGERVSVGDELRLNVLGEPVPLVVTAVGGDWEGEDRDWVVVDRNVLEAASAAPAALDWVLVGDAPRAVVEDLAAEFEVPLAERALVERQLAGDPLVEATRWSYLGVALTVTTGAGLALAASMVLAGRTRRRQLALLNLLGAEARELRRAAVGEIVPPVVLGMAVGLAAGLAEMSLFADEIDIAPFAAGVRIAVAVDVRAVAVLSAVLVVVATAVALAVARGAGRTELGKLLREEGAR